MQNIFKFAKKELSQDAVIACILNEKDENSKKFLRDLIIQNPLAGSEKPEFVKNLEFDVRVVEQQHNSIDVFCVIEEKGENRKYAVIIEDKTDSSIHDNQVIRYVCNVANVEKKKERYTGIFFILVKTGLQDFWEPYYYELEAESLKDGKPAGGLIVSRKRREQVKKQLEELKKSFEGKLFFSSYNRENFQKFLTDIAWKYSWMEEYKCFLASNTSTPIWKNNMSIDFGKFKQRLVGKVLEDNPGICCSIYYPDGSGKRDPNIAVEGFYFRIGKINYCLLPVMTLRPDSVEFLLHFHVNIDSENKQGYASLKKVKKELKKDDYKKYKDDRKDMIQKVAYKLKDKGWKIEQEAFSERNYLNMCKKRVDFKNEDPSKNKEVCEAFQEIIMFSYEEFTGSQN